MKAPRLLAITMLLLSRDSVSAPELAKRFEVSVRTIYRDFEALCEAGIPVVAYPGAGGGYGIEGGFRIDRSLLKPAELGQVSAALGSLSAAFGDDGLRQVAERLRAIAPKGVVAGKPVPENYVFIELAPSLRDRGKIADLRRAIEDRRLACFGYVDAEGRESSRRVEPLALVFIWQAWYLYAYCRDREDSRLFKIARIADLRLLPERFEARCADLDSRPWNRGWMEAAPFAAVRLRFPDAARVREHFLEEDIQIQADGSAVVTALLPAEEWTVSFLLGLGLSFEVQEPEALRRLVSERCRAALALNSRA